jgi:hypothetical protein
LVGCQSAVAIAKNTPLPAGQIVAKVKNLPSSPDPGVCAPLHFGTATQAAIGIVPLHPGAVAASGCADWAAWAIGSRTLWNPTKNLDVGVDVLYTSLAKSAFGGATIPAVTTGAPTVMTVGDTHIWAGILRVQYNFYP